MVIFTAVGISDVIDVYLVSLYAADHQGAEEQEGKCHA
jgi:hypothetical protein